jgi:hypothetical protein
LRRNPINARNRTAAGFSRHSRKAGGLLPGIDVEPSKRRKDAETRFIVILADRRAEESVELRPDQRRRGRMGHVNPDAPFCFAVRSQAGGAARAF